jgi:predicted alpha/beta-hydrolase family hydrolase
MRPPDAHALFVLAHGAGADMRHPFLSAVARAMYERGVATFRFQFPYMEVGRRRPDPPARLVETVRRAVETASDGAKGLPLIAGGKSMGGRMTSQAAAAGQLSEVRGLVLLGFPLHPAGRPGTSRADHLADVRVPMLFLQGTRDALADLELIRGVCRRLSGATLHVVEGADHSFRVLKRSGRTDAAVLRELSDSIVDWLAETSATRDPAEEGDRRE